MRPPGLGDNEGSSAALPLPCSYVSKPRATTRQEQWRSSTCPSRKKPSDDTHCPIAKKPAIPRKPRAPLW